MANKRGRESFIWTDEEVELFLNVALEYKVSRRQENVDWESRQSKYADILALFLEQYPTETSSDFPHRKEDITRPIITNKLKAIRGRYRLAVDSGRKRGHGRVVLLYSELCGQIWGGSPATTTIPLGIETSDVRVSLDQSTDSDLPCAERSDGSELPELPETDSSVPPSVVKERRDLLNAKLKSHKRDRLKRRLPAETRLLHAVEEDLQLNRRMMDMMEASERQSSENFTRLTTSLVSLSSSIAEGFALLREAMHPPPQPYQTRGPYGHSYDAHTQGTVHPTTPQRTFTHNPPQGTVHPTTPQRTFTHNPPQGTAHLVIIFSKGNKE